MAQSTYLGPEHLNDPDSIWAGWWIIPLENGIAFIPPNQIVYT